MSMGFVKVEVMITHPDGDSQQFVSTECHHCGTNLFELLPDGDIICHNCCHILWDIELDAKKHPIQVATQMM